ncbi:MAG: phosphoribosylamine--glycine ligase [Candidatus Omnitrophica bacterium CG11_big_fil_rev_8_21_14_0_20_42_13]|uniref:Phosphoribosylamine--glycine ligase n=1 Tax=Candidatus Ghiorseimicrobium undicola TaxID=1974746 RepID=A0A2H0LZB8_9BACT|nr:MAG: phosphoribosylamine--glycine ligase [Candidatus Omnitrophica bacterium CG11_big_fil_rev_8_21_14_0_20_42_13]
MKILVIGSGGREHAIAWRISKSPKVRGIFCAPGNAGISEIAECVDIAADDLQALVKFAKDNSIDLTVVGPETALCRGIVDLFESQNLKIFGPGKSAARLEGSKLFAKEAMERFSIPTAKYRVFTDAQYQDALNYISGIKKYPIVIKADGLAAGKGVIIAKSKNEAEAAVKDILVDKVFASSGEKIIIEECLEGEEASILAVCDGENFLLLPHSQDHKRAFDNDQGPNTGGMGAYSPAPVVKDDILNKINKAIIKPLLDGLKSEGNIYRGILYAGLMITKEGPKVLEFNVRFGDPETQAILPRIKTDLIDVMFASIEGRLREVKLEIDSRFCVNVVLASGGYPGNYEKGKEIFGLDEAVKMPDVIVFHAATSKENGKIVTNGGRVLGVTGLGNTIKEAIAKTYQAVDKINFEGMHYRKDIGRKAVN